MAGSSSEEGNFWPGFVDAMTNVVIAMIFVVIVLALALSFSVQQILRSSAKQVQELESAKAALEAQLTAAAATAPPGAASVPEPASTERVDANLPQPTVITTRGDEKTGPAQGGTLRQVQSTLVLEYEGTAIEPDADAAARLKDAVAGVKAKLAELPPGARVALVARGGGLAYSENQRLAYMRVLVLRNLLLAQEIAPERIVTRIDTSGSGRNAVSLVVEAAP